MGQGDEYEAGPSPLRLSRKLYCKQLLNCFVSKPSGGALPGQIGRGGSGIAPFPADRDVPRFSGAAASRSNLSAKARRVRAARCPPGGGVLATRLHSAANRRPSVRL